MLICPKKLTLNCASATVDLFSVSTAEPQLKRGGVPSLFKQALRRIPRVVHEHVHATPYAHRVVHLRSDAGLRLRHVHLDDMKSRTRYIVELQREITSRAHRSDHIVAARKHRAYKALSEAGRGTYRGDRRGIIRMGEALWMTGDVPVMNQTFWFSCATPLVFAVASDIVGCLLLLYSLRRIWGGTTACLLRDPRACRRWARVTDGQVTCNHD